MSARELATIPTPDSALATVPHHQAVLETWLEGRNQNTVEAYMRDLGDFARFLAPGTKKPDPAAAVEALLALGHGEANRLVFKYVAHMKGRKPPLAPATICRRLAALRSMVRVGRMIGRVTWSIDVDSPKVESYRDTRGPEQAGYMGMWKAVRNVADQADDPVDSARAKRDLAMMMLMRDLLLRRGSCASLELADVNLDDEPATIEVLTKGKAQKRLMELPGPVRDVLAEWLEVRGDKPGPVFIRLDPAAGTAGDEMHPLDGESINRAVRRAGRRAGLKRRTHAHGLRHQGTTRLLEKNNGNIPETMAATGHLKPETVMRYNDNRLNAAGKGFRTLADDYD
jgi:integrase/recombinase XerC